VIVDFSERGTLAEAGPTLSYVKRPDFIGTDSFGFKVGDGRLESLPETVIRRVLESGFGLSPWFGAILLAMARRRE